MNKELTGLKAAMDALDFDKARKLASAYVKAHPGEFAEYADITIEGAVRAVDAFRSAGLPESQYRAEAWHLHTWEPQSIGGFAGPHKRHGN